MAQDGRQLEGLVAFVERVLLPQGFEVRTNERIFDEDGMQIAEFDIDIRGKIGSTEIAWLIECRDRPAGGAAPGSWIEQLKGWMLRLLRAVSRSPMNTEVDSKGEIYRKCSVNVYWKSTEIILLPS
jgi:hypothetical protein